MATFKNNEVAQPGNIAYDVLKSTRINYQP